MRDDVVVMTLNDGLRFPGVEFLKEEVWKEAHRGRGNTICISKGGAPYSLECTCFIVCFFYSFHCSFCYIRLCSYIHIRL